MALVFIYSFCFNTLCGYFGLGERMKKQVLIACEGASLADIEDLHELQDELKALPEEAYAKLREEILNTGFAFPFSVWRDAKKKHWIIGGHQRKKALQRLKSEGFSVPKLPIVLVEAKNIKEAKRRVLQDVAQYGKINAQGLYDFMEDASLGYEDVYAAFNLPDFDMETFETKFFGEKDGGPSAPPAAPDKLTSGATPEGSVTKIILFYTQTEYAKIIGMAADASAKLGATNLSQLFAMLLEKERKK